MELMAFKELKSQNANNEEVSYDGVGIGGTTNNINTICRRSLIWLPAFLLFTVRIFAYN